MWHKALQKYCIIEKSCALYFWWVISVQWKNATETLYARKKERTALYLWVFVLKQAGIGEASHAAENCISYAAEKMHLDFTYLHITLRMFIIARAICYNLAKRFLYVSEKNCGISEVNSLILMCKDKTVFKTTLTGKSLAQVGDMLRENTGKPLYLLAHTLLCFISGVFDFGTPWGYHNEGILSLTHWAD